MGGEPDVSRAGRDELRPVGAGDGRDRPLQDRLRRPRGALHRRLGPGPGPAGPAGVRARPGGASVVGAAPPRPERERGCQRLHRGRRRLTSIRPASPAELLDWDERTVDAPGGHALQSLAWGEHRAGSGWTADHLLVEDVGACGEQPARAVLVLRRPWPGVGGWSAYIP